MSGTEVDQHTEERADVHRNVEGLLDLVGAEVPVEEPPGQLEVPARRDRQELGETLGRSENDGLDGAHANTIGLAAKNSSANGAATSR